MASLKDAQKIVRNGKAEGWGQLVQLPENKRTEGLGFSDSRPGAFNPTVGSFHSAGFINASPEISAIIEDEAEEATPTFVTPGGSCCNWIAADIPYVIPLSK